MLNLNLKIYLLLLENFSLNCALTHQELKQQANDCSTSISGQYLPNAVIDLSESDFVTPSYKREGTHRTTFSALYNHYKSRFNRYPVKYSHRSVK